MVECVVPTPLARNLAITSDGGQVVAARFVSRAISVRRITDPVLREAAAQVRAYFARRLPCFDIPLHHSGTVLQVEVWRAVSTLAFGQFVSYADIARALGHPRSYRGVAAALAKTPIALFVPAHRVIGADGQLKGCAKRSMRAQLASFERPQRPEARRYQR